MKKVKLAQWLENHLMYISHWDDSAVLYLNSQTVACCRHFFPFHSKIFVRTLLCQFSCARKLAKSSWKTVVEKVSSLCPLAFRSVKVTASSGFPWGFTWKTAHTWFPCHSCCNLVVTLVKCLQLYTLQNFTSKVEFPHFCRSLIQLFQFHTKLHLHLHFYTDNIHFY